MKAIVTNNGQAPIDVSGRSVAPGSSYTFTGLNPGQVSNLQSRLGAGQKLRTQFEAYDYELVKLKKGAEANPASGVTTLAIAFSVRDKLDANDVTLALKFGIALFTDAECTQLATGVVMKTATAGAFVTGANSNDAVVTADASGDFAFTVEIPTAAARHIYVATFAVADSQRLIDSTDVKDITFSP